MVGTDGAVVQVEFLPRAQPHSSTAAYWRCVADDESAADADVVDERVLEDEVEADRGHIHRGRCGIDRSDDRVGDGVDDVFDSRRDEIQQQRDQDRPDEATEQRAEETGADPAVPRHVDVEVGIGDVGVDKQPAVAHFESEVAAEIGACGVAEPVLLDA